MPVPPSPPPKISITRPQVLYDDGSLRLRTIGCSLTPKVASTLVKEIQSAAVADGFDLKVGSKPAGIPLTVDLISRVALKRIEGEDSSCLEGLTIGARHIYFIKDSYQTVDRDPAVMARVSAHELKHAQIASLCGTGDIPSYLNEGLAESAGDRFGAATSREDIEYVLETLVSATPAQARRMFHRFVSGESCEDPGDGVFTDLGALYIEYLRTKFREKGIPDANARLLRVCSEVGEGATYDQAFAHQMGGVTVVETQRAFIRFIRATRKKPQTRLEGTIYQPLSQQWIAEKKSSARVVGFAASRR